MAERTFLLFFFFEHIDCGTISLSLFFILFCGIYGFFSEVGVHSDCCICGLWTIWDLPWLGEPNSGLDSVGMYIKKRLIDILFICIFVHSVFVAWNCDVFQSLWMRHVNIC